MIKQSNGQYLFKKDSGSLGDSNLCRDDSEKSSTYSTFNYKEGCPDGFYIGYETNSKSITFNSAMNCSPLIDTHIVSWTQPICKKMIPKLNSNDGNPPYILTKISGKGIIPGTNLEISTSDIATGTQIMLPEIGSLISEGIENWTIKPYKVDIAQMGSYGIDIPIIYSNSIYGIGVGPGSGTFVIEKCHPGYKYDPEKVMYKRTGGQYRVPVCEKCVAPDGHSFSEIFWLPNYPTNEIKAYSECRYLRNDAYGILSSDSFLQSDSYSVNGQNKITVSGGDAGSSTSTAADTNIELDSTSSNIVISGSLGSPSKNDHFEFSDMYKFKVTEASEFTVSVSSDDVNDIYLHIYNANGGIIGGDASLSQSTIKEDVDFCPIVSEEVCSVDKKRAQNGKELRTTGVGINGYIYVRVKQPMDKACNYTLTINANTNSTSGSSVLTASGLSQFQNSSNNNAQTTCQKGQYLNGNSCIACSLPEGIPNNTYVNWLDPISGSNTNAYNCNRTIVCPAGFKPITDNSLASYCAPISRGEYSVDRNQGKNNCTEVDAFDGKGKNNNSYLSASGLSWSLASEIGISAIDSKGKCQFQISQCQSGHLKGDQNSDGVEDCLESCSVSEGVNSNKVTWSGDTTTSCSQGNYTIPNDGCLSGYTKSNDSCVEVTQQCIWGIGKNGGCASEPENESHRIDLGQTLAKSSTGSGNITLANGTCGLKVGNNGELIMYESAIIGGSERVLFDISGGSTTTSWVLQSDSNFVAMNGETVVYTEDWWGPTYESLSGNNGEGKYGTLSFERSTTGGKGKCHFFLHYIKYIRNSDGIIKSKNWTSYNFSTSD